MLKRKAIGFFENLLPGENHILKNRATHIHFSDIVKTQNDTVKTEIDTVNDIVFSLIKQKKNITATEIGERLGMSLSTIRRKIKELKEQNTIERVGSDKTGYWKIME